MNFESIKNALVLKAGQTELFLGKHSPDILLVGGVLSVVAGGVLACMATLKAQEVWNDTKEVVGAIKGNMAKEVQEKTATKESQEEGLRALIFVGVTGGVELLKLYTPALLIAGAGILALVQSRNILTTRNAGILAALKLTQEVYDKYRGRVIEELGDEFDLHVRSGSKDDDHAPYILAHKDDKGKIKEAEIDPFEPARLKLGVSQYAKFYDESSPQWRRVPEANLFFLKAQQTNFNVQLSTRGHVFLNEVYDALGIPRTKAGALVGWVKGCGDDVVDFGLFNGYNADTINGYPGENEILLDFNVDGPIYDLI